MRFLLLFALFFSSLYAGIFEDYKDFARLMKYERNYETAKALKEKKLLFVLYVKDGCPFCSRLEEEVLTDRHVRAYIDKHFVPTIINEYDKGYPKFLYSSFAPISYIIYPKTDKVLKRIVGYMEVDQYLWQF
ncbi:hypothetical protein MNB_SM-7-1252 [hydrothermal vent metagenome]|uniref:Thioredoxin-like fold domain-containing protein n=1 Tax=hydrothermal vent metagenome TaxID=652676 RepID=A0A1W1BFZ8_9ZZZZ